MIKQCLPGACGLAAVVNLCELLGVAVAERDVVGVMDRSPDLEAGIDETALALALLRLGMRGVHARYDAHALPCIASFDRGEHWVVLDNGRVIDSSADAPLEARPPPAEIDRRWRHNGAYFSLLASAREEAKP